MYYRVDDAVKAVINVDDYRSSAHALAATTLRNVLGTRSLGEILSDRVTIATEIYSLLVEGTNNWGVTVERVEVKEVRVPEQLVAAMAAEAQAARDARGKVRRERERDDGGGDGGGGGGGGGVTLTV